MKNILMGSENPDGHCLEELLAQISVEIKGKTAKVSQDKSPISIQIQANNSAIITLLRAAEEIQRSSLSLLNSIGPNEGPLGTPRIGRKS